jgi:hypothetical protein
MDMVHESQERIIAFDQHVLDACVFQVGSRMKPECFDAAWMAWLRTVCDCATLVGLGIITPEEAAADPLCMCPVCSQMGGNRGALQWLRMEQA